MFKGILLKSRSISILLLVKTPTLSRYFHLTEIMPFKKEKNSHRKIIIEREKKNTETGAFITVKTDVKNTLKRQEVTRSMNVQPWPQQ
jgi:hypothetical protein